MFVTLVAVFCQLNSPICLEKIIADSDMDARLTWMSCQIDAQQGITAWLKDNPEYGNWRLAKWKCVPGHYIIPGQA